VGGGSIPSQPSTPAAPPSSGETSAQAIQAQIDALPKILAAQQQYGGQFSQQQLDQLNQYGPQFAQAALDLQNKFAPQYKQLTDTFNPEVGAAQDTLTNFLKQTDQQEYDTLAPGILDQVRSGQSQRGIGAISPLGSLDESVQLAQLKSSLKDRRLNIALATAGRSPVSGMANIQGNPGSGQLVQNVNPDSIFNYQQGLNNFNSQIFGTQAQLYNTNYNNVTARRGQNMDMINKMTSDTGALGTSFGGAYLLGMCWVASELFGGWYEPKTVAARYYISEIGPKWFKNIYLKHGEKFAKFISNKPWLKNMIRPLFEFFSKVGSKVIL